MCDKFDMSLCVSQCFNKSNEIHRLIHIEKSYTDMGLCVKRKHENDSYGYCFFELDVRKGTNEHLEWDKLIGDYFYYCGSDEEEGIKGKLLEFLNKHVKYTGDIENSIKDNCPYYTEVIMLQYSKKKEE